MRRVAIPRRKLNASLRWHFTGGREMLRTGGARMRAAQQQEHKMYIRCKLSQNSLPAAARHRVREDSGRRSSMSRRVNETTCEAPVQPMRKSHYSSTVVPFLAPAFGLPPTSASPMPADDLPTLCR